MAIKHEDGSVTLTEKEFRSCAIFMEMSSTELLSFLGKKGDDFTKEEVMAQVMQTLQLASFPPDGLPN